MKRDLKVAVKNRLDELARAVLGCVCLILSFGLVHYVITWGDDDPNRRLRACVVQFFSPPPVMIIEEQNDTEFPESGR